MIAKALADYLRSTEPITGYPATPFREPQTVGDLTINNREEARRYVRSRVGDEIYAARKPRNGSQNLAVTLRRIVTNRVHEIGGGAQLADAIIQTDVWARYEPNPELRAEITATLIRLCCEGFGASTWGDIVVADCMVVREGEFSETPIDGDDWTYRYSMDLMIFYNQPSAVV